MSRFLGLFLVALGVVLDLVGVGVLVAAFTQANPAPALGLVGFALFGAGLVALVAGVLVLRATRPRRVPADATGTRVGGYVAGVPEERAVDGVAYSVLFTPAVKRGKSSTPSSLKVSVPAGSPADVRFHRRTGFDRFGHSVGLSRPVPTDDPAFDDAVAVRASHDAYADRVVSDENARSAVLGILEAGFPKVALTGADAVAEWQGFDPLKHGRPALADDAARHVAALAAALPDADGLDLSPRARPHVPLWVMLGGSALLIAAVPFYPPVRESQLFGLAVVVFAGAYPLFALAAGVLVRGTTVGHDRWIALVLAAAPLLGLASVGGVGAANGALDPGPEVVRECVVVDRTTHRAKNKRKYHVVINDWARPGSTLSYEVGESTYDTVKPGKSVVLVTTRPGGLGIEWQVGKRVQP